MFAGGVEALERGDASAAETRFAELSQKYPAPAWKARVDLFRARRLLESGPAARAVEALAAADARPIGLEGYRQYFLAIAFEHAHRLEEARSAYFLAARDPAAEADRAAAATAAARLSKSPAEKRQALAALEGAASAASGEQREPLFSARARLAAELGDDDALSRAASELLDTDPALLFHANLPPALAREARRQARALPDARQLALAEHLFLQGETAGALGETRDVDGEALTPVEKRRWHLLLARIHQRSGKVDAADREAQRVGAGAPEEGAAALVTAEDALRRALTRRGRNRRNITIRDVSPGAARRLAALFHRATSDDSTA